MIVEAPDGKVIEFPASMDAKTIEGEMGKLYPTAKTEPSKSTNGMKLSSGTILPVNPNVMTPTQGLNQLGSGVTRGLANMAGMPVDLANTALKIFGMGSDKPWGGSQRLTEALGDLGAFAESKTPGEKILSAIGEQAPYALPGIGMGAKGGATIGNLIKQAAKPTLGAGIASGATRSMTDNPIADMVAQVVGGIAGGGIPELARGLQAKIAETKLPEKFMAGAIKMPLSKKWTRVRGPEETSQVEKAASKAVEERIRPSEFGQAQTKAGRKSTGEQIGAEVEKTEGTGSLDDILTKGLSEARKRAKAGENTLGELEAIDAWEDAYKESKKGTLTPKKMQELKLELDERINWDKVSGKGDPLVDTMRKGVRHELRVALEELNPELKNLNKSDQAWILLDEALDRSLAKANNRDIVGLGTKVLLGRESWPLAAINATIGHPQVKATLAFALDKARQAARRGLQTEIGNLPKWPQGGLDKTFANQPEGWTPKGEQESGIPRDWLNKPFVPDYPWNPGEVSTPPHPTLADVRARDVMQEALRTKQGKGVQQNAVDRMTESIIGKELGIDVRANEGIALLKKGAGTTPKELLSSPEKIVVRPGEGQPNTQGLPRQATQELGPQPVPSIPLSTEGGYPIIGNPGGTPQNLTQLRQRLGTFSSPPKKPGAPGEFRKEPGEKVKEAAANTPQSTKESVGTTKPLVQDNLTRVDDFWGSVKGMWNEQIEQASEVAMRYPDGKTFAQAIGEPKGDPTGKWSKLGFNSAVDFYNNVKKTGYKPKNIDTKGFTKEGRKKGRSVEGD
jgi:hypothetical protein